MADFGVGGAVEVLGVGWVSCGGLTSHELVTGGEML